ncbi:hypothetical protein [Campylobacter sp.]|uniref:hypothetical protein n=1 Tax=Campylobacter sp. TaxID=205 RepID=UPI002A57B40C|nr:hypothetical protein [Campylobacter sp.]MDD7090344.1 hypothetical protein [Campylobacteraceae bacterium]MDY5285956.1 hypothetical protein [Campylobacter sp.]
MAIEINEVYTYLSTQVKPQLENLTRAVLAAKDKMQEISSAGITPAEVTEKLNELKETLIAGDVGVNNANRLDGKTITEIMEQIERQIKATLNLTTLLDDESDGEASKTYSSAKIKELLALNVEIDDTKSRDNATYSSKKIEQEIARAALSGVSEERVNELIAAAKLAGGGIDEERLKALIAAHIAKNQGVGALNEEQVKELIKETLKHDNLKALANFSGEGAPESNTATSSAPTGATYFDNTASKLYIKQDSGWQEVTNVDAPDLSGVGVPSSTATLGQTYKDNLTGSIYVYTLVNAESKWKRLVNNVKEVNSVSAKTWSGEGEPKTATTDAGMSEVKIGDIYHDTITDIYYMCVNISANTLTWKAVSEVEKETEYPKVESNAIFGEIGGLGAGVAYLPETAATVGLTPMSGASDVSSENFGNFVDSNKNVFVCIPLMFYKADTDERNTAFYDKPNIYISYVAKEGYAPFYAFKKSDGSYVPCVFVSKYLMSISKGKAISKKNQDVAMSAKGSSSSDYDDSIHIGKIPGCQNRNDNFFTAAKSMNANTVLHYAALRFVYYMVAEAHMQAAVRKFGSISSVPSFICAYLDVEPYFPKGCNNKLSDINDKSIKYTQGAYSFENCGMTGSCNKPEKTSFNGQKCGIVDMGGLADEVDAGYIVADYGRYERTYILKGIDLLKSLNKETYTNTENYIQLDLKHRRTRGTSYYGSSEGPHGAIIGNEKNPIFSFSYPDTNNDDEVNEYNCDNFLNPLSTAMGGTTAYGQDYNRKLEKNYTPVFGGSYYSSHGGSQGCGLLYFTGYRHNWSEGSSLCSARTMIVPN